MDRVMSSDVPVGHATVESSVATPGAQAPDTLIELRNVSVRYGVRRELFARGKPEEILAVDRVTLSVRRGRSLGLVGRTGSGKSTIAQLVMGMLAPTSGSIVVAGRHVTGEADHALRRLVQVVLQDPYSSLDPRMRVREIVAEPLSLGLRIRGKAKTEIHARVDELLELVGLLPSAAERYPNQFSGGQRQRIAIARALASRPQLIILDEPTSALDVSVRAQILNLLRSLQEELGVTYLTISHDIHTVSYLAAEVAVMDLGRIVEIGPTTDVLRAPRHPYTLELVSSIPGASRGFLELPRPTSIASDFVLAAGCRFAARCPLRTRLGDPAACVETEPELSMVRPHHRAACHFPEELAKLGDA
jgi:oligopeptide/dipeptide ABC transporter ATP-binding protein